MDLKTLEYMKIRVNRGRIIQDNITALKGNLDRLCLNKSVDVYVDRNCMSSYLKEENLRFAIKALIETRITELEAEFDLL